MREINKIIIHCSDSAFGDAKLINKWHLERGFDEIGYNYVICNGYIESSKHYNKYADGEVQIGRDIEKIPAHCRGQNSHSIGICLIGVDEFSDVQLAESLILVRKLMKKYNLKISDVYGHYEFNTNKTCPNIDMNSYREQLQIIEKLSL